ncbi:AraC family transcriptional regulator [Enterococcus massiliensis]|uniref:AraC family transcriptional regulator n=1 Tax=Enterococcus massiliensis TaxID=1640685 RepID=UPI00065DD945|nr:AraC family transcriptional regulator [Enterococcus massiliensis]
MTQPKKASQVNTMISDQYEIYHVKDVVSQEKTIYHSHDFYEVHTTLSGVGSFYLEGKQFNVTEGTVLLIHYNDLHRIIKQNTNLFERVYIFLTPQFLASRSTKRTNLEDCFQPLGNHKSRIIQANPQKLKKLLSFIDEKPDASIYGSDIKYEQKLIDYMIFLNQLVQKEESENQSNTIVQNERIEQIIQYISTHLTDALSLEEMEKTFFVSKYYITREFKKHTGITFHQFVLKKRLLYSKQLLKEYKNSSQVYSKAGFTSYPHFLKAFKKEFGLTPKEFIKRDESNQKIHFKHYED